jgi:hypothetical protein
MDAQKADQERQHAIFRENMPMLATLTDNYIPAGSEFDNYLFILSNNLNIYKEKEILQFFVRHFESLHLNAIDKTLRCVKYIATFRNI